MRILAIRGENLASLAAPFELTLDEAPLGTTGIFAITGETGSGKSTILDALCLALYGRYPRVSAGQREDVPDPSGLSLGSSDARVILRRGAGKGFAEVDFLGRDGVAYRARWEAYRARGQANGRFQNEARSLHRITDGAAVATGKTQVLAAVEATTDLTFEQFRRTVVLAQGEFDTFLLASEVDRAELLEKITGTAVYSEISKRVHAGTGEQRATCAALVARHDAIGLLDPDAREARLAELAGIEETMPGLVAEQVALAAALDHSRRLVAAQAQLAAAAMQATEAAAAVQAGHADAERLGELDVVEPMRRRAQALTTSEATLAVAREVRDKAMSEVEAAETTLAETRTGQAAAHAADEARETDLSRFTPIWSKADVLDARVAELDREAEAAATTATKAAVRLEAARTRRTALDQAHETAVAALDETTRRITTDAAKAPLADRAAEIVGLFGKRKTVVAAVAVAHAALSKAQGEISAFDEATASARERAASAREAREALIAARAVPQEELRGLDLEAVETRHGHLQDLLERLAAASELARRHGGARAELERAHASQADATTSRELAADRRTTAETAQGQAARARTEIAKMADLAESSASAEAAHLRSVLVPGKPCPVCGSANHPHVEHGHGGDELARLAEAMRGRRGAIDRELADAGREIAAAIAAEAGATARFEAATREGALAEASLSNDARAYAELLPELTTACVSVGLRETPLADLELETIADLKTVIDAAMAARTITGATLQRARILSSDIGTQGQAIEIKDGEIDAADGIIGAKAGPRHEAALAAERQSTRATDLAERVASLDRELAQYLAVADLSVADLAQDPDGTASRVAEIGAAYRELRERHRGLQTDHTEIQPRRAAAVEAELAATSLRDGAVQEATDRAGALKEARLARAELLGGEATDRHRARVTAARAAARAALRSAEEALGSAAAIHASARGSLEHSIAQCGRASELLAQARTDFLAGCGERDPEVVSVLLAVPMATRTDLRDARDRLLRAHEAAMTALATRTADLDDLRARPAIEVPETEAAAARIADLIAGHQMRRGALNADLARDDAARGQAANLASKIAAARASLADWEAVDAAVGSAGGDRFRRFAQGVTLEHLAQLANEQLRILSPRYALVRSRGADLSLHVLDRDMGDELRGTRSLSGGERFLVALALALALSGLEGRQNFVDTLFIDEGFGSLDAETLDVAVDALETLQGQGRRVGVITHVAAMIDRIAVQVRVDRHGNGRSTVRVTDGAVPV